MAYVILLSKSTDTSKADQFRPIALGNAMGKLFFTLMQNRATEYMLNNKYIDVSVQKAFLPGISVFFCSGANRKNAMNNSRPSMSGMLNYMRH